MKRAYVDLHSHLLPGLDDGPAELAESLSMARVCLRDGITDVVATPHHVHGRTRALAPETVRTALERMRAALAREKIGLRLHEGMEVFAEGDVREELERGAVLPLANSRYVLIEFALFVRPDHLEQTLFSLQLAGFIPVVAHFERATYLKGDEDWPMRLAQSDVLLQVNADSLLGEYGSSIRARAWRLLASGAADFVASDAHGAVERPNRLVRAAEEIRDRLGDETSQRLCAQNPGRVLDGVPVAKRELRQENRTPLWRRLMRK